MAGNDPELHALESDADDDEALRYAIELSLQDQTPVTPGSTNKALGGQDLTASRETGGSFDIRSLDRKKMEDERLVRLATKRRAPSQAEDTAITETQPLEKRQQTAPKTRGADHAKTRAPQVPYPHGTVKRTWARGYPRSDNDIKMEEVLQKDTLLLAMLSSYQWDEEWILSKIDSSKTKLLLVAFAADDRQKAEMRANAPPGVRFCFPPMHGPGSMHSKLQLLKYPDYLRVVVPTGNLVSYDWGETGVMENMVFIIDLPRLDERPEHSETPFCLELKSFLLAMGVEGGMVDSLSNFDFSGTTNLGFVYSRPGGHTDEALKRVGYCGLGTTIASLGLATQRPVEVDLVCASLGAVKTELVEALYSACQGYDETKKDSYTARASSRPSDKRSGPSKLLKDRFRIYFPANRTVCSSRGGKRAAGTICVQEKWWCLPDFPRELIRDCVNNRDGLLMHSKVIFVRRARCSDESCGDGFDAGACAGWAYVGSANLSESAWGRVVKDRKSGKAKINCRNWECGVVVPVRGTAVDSKDGNEYGAGLRIFDGTVPVPMQMPGRVYDADETPWFYDSV